MTAADTMHSSPTDTLPWIDNDQSVYETANDALPCDGLALLIMHTDEPALDGVLCTSGVDTDRLAHWCRESYADDALLRRAQQRGWATLATDDADAEHAPTDARHAVMVAQPAGGDRRCWWLLLLTRQARPFTPVEQDIAALLLRQWQVRFDHRGEPAVGRMLIGHDDRLLYADPFTAVRIARDPRVIPQMLASLGPVIEQRWPDSRDAQPHDFAIYLADEPYWVVAAKRALIDHAPDAFHWYIELRHMPDMDLPALGRIEDDRIARAIGYIHDHYHTSPSLTQVAQAVHVSPFHFHRLYTRHVGISPKQYLQRKQLQVAKWLLHATRLPIGDIARKTGFSSHGHFTSTFHRLIGQSPSEYRERS